MWSLMYPIATQRDSPRRSLGLDRAVVHSKSATDAKSIPRFDGVSLRFALVPLELHAASIHLRGPHASPWGVHVGGDPTAACGCDLTRS